MNVKSLPEIPYTEDRSVVSTVVSTVSTTGVKFGEQTVLKRRSKFGDGSEVWERWVKWSDGEERYIIEAEWASL